MEIGRLHVVVVHFPIALAFAAVLADVLGLLTRKEWFRHAGLYCLVLAALSAVPAVVTGMAVAGPRTSPIVSAHKWWAIAALAAAFIAAGVRLARRDRLRGWWLGAYVLLIAAFVASVAITGHYGGMLVYGKDFLFGPS